MLREKNLYMYISIYIQISIYKYECILYSSALGTSLGTVNSSGNLRCHRQLVLIPASASVWVAAFAFVFIIHRCACSVLLQPAPRWSCHNSGHPDGPSPPPSTTTYHHHLPPPPTTIYHHPPPMINMINQLGCMARNNINSTIKPL